MNDKKIQVRDKKFDKQMKRNYKQQVLNFDKWMTREKATRYEMTRILASRYEFDKTIIQQTKQDTTIYDTRRVLMGFLGVLHLNWPFFFFSFLFFLFLFFLGTSRRPLLFYRFRTNDVLLWHFWAPVCISVSVWFPGTRYSIHLQHRP